MLRSWAALPNNFSVKRVRLPDRNSPMTFSAGLSDPLLLIHGMQDDVVPFKTTMVLMERLMEQGNHCFGA